MITGGAGAGEACTVSVVLPVTRTVSRICQCCQRTRLPWASPLPLIVAAVFDHAQVTGS